tara:strand:+ start:2305 stop:2751 length:447 start_codon:yes stop_codon:yes gene_type:complete
MIIAKKDDAMSEKKYDLNVGDIVQADETWLMDERAKNFFRFPVYLTQENPACPASDKGFTSFSEQFGESARLIITAIEHDDNGLCGPHDMLVLQLLNDNGDFNPLAPIFYASANAEFEPEAYGLQKINVVDHYQQVLVPSFVPMNNPQ